jgi:hypothetical protein
MPTSVSKYNENRRFTAPLSQAGRINSIYPNTLGSKVLLDATTNFARGNNGIRTVLRDREQRLARPIRRTILIVVGQGRLR